MGLPPRRFPEGLPEVPLGHGGLRLRLDRWRGLNWAGATPVPAPTEKLVEPSSMVNSISLGWSWAVLNNTPPIYLSPRRRTVV